MPVSSGLESILRWLHILAGVIWMGNLYFLNFVNVPVVEKLDAETRKAIVPELMPRAMWWFRWGAAWTWFTGVLLLMLIYYMNRMAVEGNVFVAGSYVMLSVTFLAVFVYDFLFDSALASNAKVASFAAFVSLGCVVFLYASYAKFSYRGMLIHTGALLGTVMAFNAWYRIWPSQRRIIRAIKEGTDPAAADVKRARVRSRHNAYLSVPLLWAMIGQHTTFFAGGNLGIRANHAWLVWLVIILVGWHIVFHLLKRAGRIQGI